MSDLVLSAGQGLPYGLVIPDAELIERFSRSSGFVLQIFRQCAAGKSAKAVRSAISLGAGQASTNARTIRTAMYTSVRHCSGGDRGPGARP